MENMTLNRSEFETLLEQAKIRVSARGTISATVPGFFRPMLKATVSHAVEAYSFLLDAGTHTFTQLAERINACYDNDRTRAIAQSLIEADELLDYYDQRHGM